MTKISVLLFALILFGSYSAFAITSSSAQISLDEVSCYQNANSPGMPQLISNDSLGAEQILQRSLDIAIDRYIKLGGAAGILALRALKFVQSTGKPITVKCWNQPQHSGNGYGIASGQLSPDFPQITISENAMRDGMWRETLAHEFLHLSGETHNTSNPRFKDAPGEYSYAGLEIIRSCGFYGSEVFSNDVAKRVCRGDYLSDPFKHRLESAKVLALGGRFNKSDGTTKFEHYLVDIRSDLAPIGLSPEYLNLTRKPRPITAYGPDEFTQYSKCLALLNNLPSDMNSRDKFMQISFCILPPVIKTKISMENLPNTNWDAKLYKNLSFDFVEFPSSIERMKRLSLSAIIFRDSGWSNDIVIENIKEASKILKQCGLMIDKLELVNVDRPSSEIDILPAYDMESNPYVYATGAKSKFLPLFFFKGTNRWNGLAIAYASYKFSGTAVENNVFFSFNSIPWTGNGFNTIAHELGHLLTNAGHIDTSEINLMQSTGYLQGSSLTKEQCKTMQKSPLLKP